MEGLWGLATDSGRFGGLLDIGERWGGTADE